MMFSTLSVTALRSAGTGSYLIFPLSMLLISSTSLMRESRCSELSSIFFRQFCTSGFGSFFIAMVVKPIMAFIGVRMSCDILLRKVVFAMLALCASASACASFFWLFRPSHQRTEQRQQYRHAQNNSQHPPRPEKMILFFRLHVPSPHPTAISFCIVSYPIKIFTMRCIKTQYNYSAMHLSAQDAV